MEDGSGHGAGRRPDRPGARGRHPRPDGRYERVGPLPLRADGMEVRARLPRARAQGGRDGAPALRGRGHARRLLPQRRADRRVREHVRAADLRRDGPPCADQPPRGADPLAARPAAPRRARPLARGRHGRRDGPQGAARLRLGHHAAPCLARHLAERRARRPAAGALRRRPLVRDERQCECAHRLRARGLPDPRAVAAPARLHPAPDALARRKGRGADGARGALLPDARQPVRPQRRPLVAARDGPRAGALRRDGGAA